MHPITPAHTSMRNTTGMIHNVKVSIGTATAARLDVYHTIFYGLPNGSSLTGSPETKLSLTATAVQPTYVRHAMSKSKRKDTSSGARKIHNMGGNYMNLYAKPSISTQWTQTSGN
jgi:hypothetical protein